MVNPYSNDGGRYLKTELRARTFIEQICFEVPGETCGNAIGGVGCNFQHVLNAKLPSSNFDFQGKTTMLCNQLMSARYLQFASDDLAQRSPPASRASYCCYGFLFGVGLR